jgi:hypothetical protein
MTDDRFTKQAKDTAAQKQLRAKRVSDAAEHLQSVLWNDLRLGSRYEGPAAVATERVRVDAPTPDAEDASGCTYAGLIRHAKSAARAAVTYHVHGDRVLVQLGSDAATFDTSDEEERIKFAGALEDAWNVSIEQRRQVSRRTSPTQAFPLTRVDHRGDSEDRMKATVRSLDDERKVLHELVAAVKATGWFPRSEDFRTEENYRLLDLMDKRLDDEPQLLIAADGFYAWTGAGLRLIKDDAFCSQELEHAAELLDLLRKRYNRKQRDPVHVQALQVELGWEGEPNDVRRAVYLLATEFTLAVQFTGAPATLRRVPEQVMALEGIWKASRDLLLSGPPPVPRVAPPPAQRAPQPVLAPAEAAAPRVKPESRKVFVVHGHDNAAKLEVELTLRKLDLIPVILHDEPNRGRTIIEKFEAHAEGAASSTRRASLHIGYSAATVGSRGSGSSCSSYVPLFSRERGPGGTGEAGLLAQGPNHLAPGPGERHQQVRSLGGRYAPVQGSTRCAR